MKREEQTSSQMLDRAIAEARQTRPSSDDVNHAAMRVLDRLRDSAPRTSLPSESAPALQQSRDWGWLTPTLAGVVIVALFIAGEIVFFQRLEQIHNPDRVKETILTEDSVRTLRLQDGSQLEVSPRAAFSIESTSDGVGIELARGSVIVVAAKQAGGRRLRVQTASCRVSVVGTVFAVTAEYENSRVSVIEGAVELEVGGVSERLVAGQQRSTQPGMKTVSFAQELQWSPNAATYMALLQPVAQFSSSPQFGLAPIQTAPIVTAPIEVAPITVQPIQTPPPSDDVGNVIEGLRSERGERAPAASAAANNPLGGRAAGGAGRGRVAPPSTIGSNWRGAGQRGTPSAGQIQTARGGGDPEVLINRWCTGCHPLGTIVEYAARRNSEQPPPAREEYEALVSRENARRGGPSATERRDVDFIVNWLLGARYR